MLSIMDELAVKVKQEKIDPEIEQKIKDQSTQQKRKLPDNNESKEESSDTNSIMSTDSKEDREEEEVEDKKNIEMVKSSNQLLAELFQVFNATPPVELLNDEDLLKKTKRMNKHKKEKKKKRKRHKDDEALENDSNKLDSDDIAIKKEKHRHKKKKRHKHKEDERPKIKEEEKQRARSKEKEKERRKSAEKQKSNDPKDGEIITSHITKERDIDIRHKDESKRKRPTVKAEDTEPPAKIYISSHDKKRSVNSFYNGSNDHENEREPTTKTKSDSRRSNNKNHLDRTDISDISLSDEETYLREREHASNINTIAGERRRQQSYQSSRHSRNHSRHSNERYRPRSRSKNRSRSRDLGIDKKRLLEIARKNAISMFKRGNLPGCADMTEDVKDKVLLQMRYGGRTVQDLTDFCRKISNGEPLSSMSSDNDSDVDKNGNTKAFHHPFQLKERDPIVMHLRSSKPIPTTSNKSEDLTKAITMQFPVSSGQQHRISENWMPVETKPPESLPSLQMPAQSSTCIFKPNVKKNVFEKSLPTIEQQEPAFRPHPPTDSNIEKQTVNPSVETLPNSSIASASQIITSPPPLPPPLIVHPNTNQNCFIPDVAVPSCNSNTNTSNSIFPAIDSSASFDVSSIISKRLSALRRLQENPMDSEAIKMMYNSQREMSSWASSKHLPGQFTGSTGAIVLKAHELNSGPEVWARRDQLTSTKPVSGGMGMHLLQKMGWKPGEGLGREKTGALQPLLLDVKLDKRGLEAKDDHIIINGSRNPGGGGNKKRPSSINEAKQNFQNKHPVCILNELTSKRKWTPPLYELVSEGGPSHNKNFLFSVSMNGQVFTPPEGSNTKKEAKLLAAKFCLEQIGILPTTQ